MNAHLNVLELFAGIGGLSLGLERAGMNVVGQVEIDHFCQRVLAKHWLEVPKHDDVRTAVEWWRSGDRPRVDVVAGGPPCQPFSRAGNHLGVGDDRWAWPWMLDVVRVVRPRFVLLENVAALLDDRDAFGRILGDLAAFGFDAEWSVLSACSVGAPHPRQRVFLVAYPSGTRLEGVGVPRPVTDGARWGAEPRVGRVADGSPVPVDRLRALGNAVVPQVSEHIGRLIIASQARAVAA